MMKEPISLDTALQIVGSLKVRAIKEKSTLTNLVEKDALDQKIKMYLKEEKMLYGTDDMARLSVMDKVVHYYSPLIKQMNGVL
ncbi:conserved hypothetical protein [Capnocytophaga ochracea DSM 7271]|jgi:hypothetical protein|uniref:Uncharacterized protein n=3 Tax=Capnocytophaga TaxID=1016 RepID=C7M647_CAPOD|nr:conserved hypothetical protein [Capnocytophaga ochracea DSM 7271]ATA70085.1 hypothetical protein CGC57_03810 [Capnocytophaga sputigena]EKY07944.1 hypothetical protein HMPREF9078_01057 [Capnocytophaga sp. oral taxon 380 str. F0488]EKY18186.1 hypothetical protein HMPREF9072_00039 [Capnocytophaga sp. oral taxon 324 str. F0483]ATA79012.1 hypothetical protein CGC59_04640 [Capnocytophaga sputigena]